MLRACKRILKPGGRTAFFTIVTSEGLSKPAHRRAVRLGPRAVSAGHPPDGLMAAAGFSDVEITDVTDAFVTTARAWLRESARFEDDLRAFLGAEFDEKQSDRRDMVTGVEEGLLKRLLVVGSAP